MPFGSFVNHISAPIFLVIHVALFLLATVLATRSFRMGGRGLGSGFSLFAASEAVYMTYHLDWTVFLFAHTIAEVLTALAFVTIFAALSTRTFAGVRR